MRDLNGEEELLELLESLGFIDKNLEGDVKLAKEIMTILDNKLSRRNLLVFLCQLERVHLSWMAPAPVEGQEESKDSHGSFNDKGEFMVTEVESKRL